MRLAGGEAAAAADTWISGFRDVPAAITDEVDYAAHQGWVTGVTTVEFRPGEPLTANAWAAFLLRMLGWSDRDGDFAVSDAAAFAQRVACSPPPIPASSPRATCSRPRRTPSPSPSGTAAAPWPGGW